MNAARRARKPRQLQQEQLTAPRTVVLPYIRGVSEASERLMRPFNVRVAHRPVAKLKDTMCQLKDPVPSDEKAGVVYSIPCQGCDQKYVGESGKQLKTRIHEHKLALRRADLKSHVWTHCSQTGHEINFNETSILARSDKKAERLVLESIFSTPQSTYNRCVELDSHYTAVVAQL